MAPLPLKWRVMVDANILIAGTVWPRWPFEVLQHSREGDFQLILSQFVINQAMRRISTRFPDYVESFNTFISLNRFELIPEPTQHEIDAWQHIVRDPTDVPVALTAVNARVDYLVSEDKDLTARDNTTVELRRHLTVLLSGTFLREVMGWSSEALERIRGRTWKDII
jgi:putative PIN family toxin of toxin-antitoxin system